MADEHLQDEAEVIWLVDPSKIPYVREEDWLTTRRNLQPPKSTPDWQVVGHSTAKDSKKRSQGQSYYRLRLFTLRPYDRANDPNGFYKTGYPAEAVDPLSVKAGVRGSQELPRGMSGS